MLRRSNKVVPHIQKDIDLEYVLGMASVPKRMFFFALAYAFAKVWPTSNQYRASRSHSLHAETLSCDGLMAFANTRLHRNERAKFPPLLVGYTLKVAAKGS